MARSKKIQVKAIKTNTGSAIALHRDPDRVRRQHIKNYKQQQAAFKRSNDILRRLEEVEKPAFHLWRSTTFVAEYHAMILLRYRYEELEMLSDAVQEYRTYRGGNNPQAYAKVIEAHRQGRLGEMMDDMVREFEESEDACLDDENETDECEDSPSDFEDVRRDFNESTKDKSRPDARSESSRQQKNLYRELARSLHPDFNPDQSALEQALWHQFQDAYQREDWERLNDIHSQLKGKAAVGIDLWLIPIGELAGMTADLKNKLAQVKVDLIHAKKADYWDFEKRRHQKTFIDHLVKRIGREIAADTNLLRSFVQELEDCFARWSRPRKPKPARKPTTSAPARRRDKTSSEDRAY